MAVSELLLLCVSDVGVDNVVQDMWDSGRRCHTDVGFLNVLRKIDCNGISWKGQRMTIIFRHQGGNVMVIRHT